jgi:membrane fusion protein (multidrug efflux system)
VAQAQAQLVRTHYATASASVEQVRALLAQALLNLSYTKIYATQAGTVANKNVEAGNFVEPGQALLSIVPDTLYVIANYKETQLARVRPGQHCVVTVDALPGVRLQGHVDSIQRGTGSRFALLPPENATGNFVKVVQRVPVKITLDNREQGAQLITPGMSVETRIDVEERPTWLRFLN